MILGSIAWIKSKNSDDYEITKMMQERSDSKEIYICIVRENKEDAHWNNYEKHILWADDLAEAISFFSVEFPNQPIEIDLKGNVIWISNDAAAVSNGGQYSLF